MTFRPAKLALLSSLVALVAIACDENKPVLPNDTDDQVEVDTPAEIHELSETEVPEETDDPDEVSLPDEVEEELPPCVCEEGQCGVIDCGTDCGTCADGYLCGDDHLCAPRCDVEAFVPVEQTGTMKPETAGFKFQYAAVNAKTQPFDALFIDYKYKIESGPVVTGVFDAAFPTIRDCTYCMYMKTGYAEGETPKLLIPIQGSIDVKLMSNTGGPFVAELSDVVFAEVAYYSSTQRMPLVKDGLQVCVPSMEINVPVAETQDTCTTFGTGSEIGDNIADINLQDCNGNWVSLHASCGKKVVWWVAVASWCSACRTWVPQVEDYLRQVGDADMTVYYILGEDNDYGQPDLAECKAYASRNNLANDRVLIDWSQGGGGWTRFFGNIDPYIPASGEFSIPFNAVLDGRAMIYEYSDSAPNSAYPDGPYDDIVDALETILNR